MPLVVPLTGNRLFTISWILGLGIPKAVYSYRGQSLISTTLDLVGGIILTLISYWLGEIKAERPELCPLFFKVDLVPCILKFLRRYDVLLWFSSVLPLLVAVEGMFFVDDSDTKRLVAKHATSGIVAQFSKNASTHLALGISLAVYLFCIHSLRVLRPGVFEGMVLSHATIFSFMMLALQSFLAVHIYSLKINSEDSIESIRVSAMTIAIVLRPYLWMTPALGVFRRSQLRSREGLFSKLSRYFNLFSTVVMYACTVNLEVDVMHVRGLPKFPGALYILLFLYCALVSIWDEFFAITPPS
ncbi:hypothetical protein DFH94DRAFT_765973 [Russula ochroleuca]|uniref:Uncharacterized protein n=1 Tax=Russula ochroleuca TaxID=152965 RepID=A0A9P5K1A0_9AGAM|nr:hypothetical protein DFH94DRAFT_765973 [Russula ochroleuca]